MQENIDAVFARNGELLCSEKLGDEVISSYEGKLPEYLLEIWRQKGVGSWGNGKYCLCLPSDFDGVLSQVFHADADFSHRECHVIAYSAFGHLTVWSEVHGDISVNLTATLMSCDGLLDEARKFSGEIALTTAFYNALQNDANDILDDNNKPLFARAKRKLGVLEAGECYGFVPALAMGGAPSLDNLSKVRAYEHFLFLAQMQQFTLMDYLSRPIRAVRTIG